MQATPSNGALLHRALVAAGRVGSRAQRSWQTAVLTPVSGIHTLPSMQYLLARDGQQLGQFSEEELRSGMFEGRYLPTDVVWTEGMGDWKPLSEVMGQGVMRVPAAKSGASSEGDHDWQNPTRTAGLAIGALVLGILSVLSCGGLGLGAIAAIICGHMALASIRKAHGALGGRGLAVTGLVMGYLSVALVVVAVLASLSTGAINKMGETRQITKGMNDARQLALGIRLYAADHGGSYPPTLDDLVASGAIEREVLDKAQSFRPAGWLGEPGFEYHGASMNDADPGSKLLLESRCHDANGKSIVVTNDTSVELARPPAP